MVYFDAKSDICFLWVPWLLCTPLLSIYALKFYFVKGDKGDKKEPAPPPPPFRKKEVEKLLLLFRLEPRVFLSLRFNSVVVGNGFNQMHSQNSFKRFSHL